MRRIVLPFLFFVLPWMRIAAAGNGTEETDVVSHVLVLDASNFTHVIKDHPFILVKFYAPWCGHCKQLAPEYEKAAAELQANEPAIALAKVDASEEQNQDLAMEYEVQGYPTMKMIRDRGAVIHEYKGPRDAQGIIAYLKRQAGPASLEITSAPQALELIQDTDVVIVGVFSSYDSKDFANFISVANNLRSDYEFRHTINADLLPPVKDSITGPTIRVFKKFDEGFNDFKELDDLEAAKDFLAEVSVPSVVYFNDDPEQRRYFAKVFMDPNLSKVFLFAEGEGEDEAGKEAWSSMKTEYTNLAKEHKGKGHRFIIAEGVNSSKMLLKYLGVRNDTLPSVFIQGKNNTKHLLEKADSSGKITRWFTDYLNGKVSEFYKSQPVPESNNEPVKVVVRDTLAGMVLHSGKNVLLEFYAPWCGYCKSLASILDEVAAEFEADPDVVIAKFDATENDIGNVAGFVVEGYPTLYFHSTSGKLTLYAGDRTKEDLISFIRLHREPIEQMQLRKSDDLKDEL